MKFRKFTSVMLGVCCVFFVVLAYASLKSEFGHLTNLADKYGTDKGSILHRFTEIYEYFFYPIKNEARKIFEIGVGEGRSLKMLRDYFPKAVIYGIDITDTSHLNSDTIKTFIADQADRKQLKDFIATHGGNFDVILDDGGHLMSQQQISFGYLFKFLKPGGYYIIEDVHTSLMGKEWGVHPDERNSTLSMINHFIRTGIIESEYMTAKEIKHLARNIEYCTLFSRHKGKSITCIFKKKVTF